jgi:hypothetical protein
MSRQWVAGDDDRVVRMVQRPAQVNLVREPQPDGWLRFAVAWPRVAADERTDGDRVRSGVGR